MMLSCRLRHLTQPHALYLDAEPLQLDLPRGRAGNVPDAEGWFIFAHYIAEVLDDSYSPDVWSRKHSVVTAGPWTAQPAAQPAVSSRRNRLVHQAVPAGRHGRHRQEVTSTLLVRRYLPTRFLFQARRGREEEGHHHGPGRRRMGTLEGGYHRTCRWYDKDRESGRHHRCVRGASRM